MRILYISHNTHLDYQDDCLFIGLRELFGSDLVDVNKKNYSYINYNKSLENFHGKGMTVTKILDDINIDREDILNKIKNKYFDFIIYGSITRCVDYLNDVLDNYQKNEIILIDGEDVTLLNNTVNLGCPYFKRELASSHNNVYPISFALPTCKVGIQQNKIKDYSFITPKDTSTYIYNDELSYYNDYKQSRFGFTMKKAGWDCLRHYEILGNGCIPYFENIENCPKLTMTTFPKELCISVKKDLIDMSPSLVYEKYIENLKIHFLKNNTTLANAENFINLIKTF